MTELSFLIDLLLTKKLPTEIKTKVVERIKEVEESYASKPIPFISRKEDPSRPSQAPSTQKILDEMAMNPEPVTPPQASTVATAQALASRQQAIAQGISGKPEPGRSSPRKF